MTINQLSIFVENRLGTLAQIFDILAQNKVRIIASTISDTRDYGILRIVCNQPADAYQALLHSGINVQQAQVLAIPFDSPAPMASEIVSKITAAGVDILYMYSFMWKERSVMILRVADIPAASAVVKALGVEPLVQEEFM